MQNTSYLQSQTIIRALEFTLAKGGFGNHAKQKLTAQTLLKNMRSNKSVSGRHQQIATLLRKGTTIDNMIKSVGSSRRTIFRYLNHFEEAGYNININGGKYRIQQ